MRASKKYVVYFLLLITATVCSGRNVSLVMGSDGNDFDPWNQSRWADWYQDGNLVEPFEIDISVKFESRTTAWEIDIGSIRALPSAYPTLFVLNNNSSVNINGNGIIIDARKSHVKLWDLYYYYTHTIGTTTDYYNSDAFLLYQTDEAGISDPGSQISNITLIGFQRAISAHHFHQRKTTISNVSLERNIWGLFPRGANVSVQNCSIKENVMGGLYGEYNSRNWIFSGNTFKDNNTRGTISYADIVLDACKNYTITDNNFLPATYNTRYYHVAISLYRNAGEASDIRELAAKDHLIENNSFNGYNIAVDFAPRMGLINSIEMSYEARCYTSGNIVRNCTFTNCLIGIILRNNYTTLAGNFFVNVQRPIVMHNVFYSMHHNVIDQPGEQVWLWSVEDDYISYWRYLFYRNGVGSQIAASEKFYHVICPGDYPTFNNVGQAKLLVCPTLLVPDKCDLDTSTVVNMADLEMLAFDWLSQGRSIPFTELSTNIDSAGSVDFKDFKYCGDRWLKDNDKTDAYSSGGKPIDIAVGNMAVYEPGDEIAVIWDEAVSKIDGTEYFSIIIYDQNGNELDRCGRSTDRWAKIVAGNFLPDTGFIQENANFEIAAVKTLPDTSGKYPVYIFRKGFGSPAVTLAGDNTSPIIAITAGNFKVFGDEYDEIAIKVQSSSQIRFLKPSDVAWSIFTTNVAVNMIDMAAGDYDGQTSNGDEIAAVTSTAGPVLLYRANSSGNYATAADCGKVWCLVAGGNFDSRLKDEIAVVDSCSTNGIYKISYFYDQSNVPFKETNIKPLSVKPVSIKVGNFTAPMPISLYDSLENISQEQFLQEFNTWGEHIAVLPSEPRQYSIPVFRMVTNPADSNENYYKLVPLLR